jgi:hypothetical protein
MSIVHGGGWVTTTRRKRWRTHRLWQWARWTFPLAAPASMFVIMKILSHELDTVFVLCTGLVGAWLCMLIVTGMFYVFETPEERIGPEKLHDPLK